MAVLTSGVMEDIPYIHESLIWEILLRCPVKSLLLFKSVSKLWLSLISDLKFTKSHFDLWPSHRLVAFSLGNDFEDNKVFFFDPKASFSDDQSIEEFVLPSMPTHEMVNGRRYWINNTCRGFLLVQFFGGCMLYNPVTKSKKMISFSGTPIDDPMLLACGYNAMEDDYLVVLFWHHSTGSVDQLKYGVFSVRADSWSMYDFPKDIAFLNGNEIRQISCFRSKPCYNGAIHYLIREKENSECHILVFDTISRTFSEMAIPYYIRDIAKGYISAEDRTSILRMMIVEGRMVISHNYVTTIHDLNVTHIWMMKEYGVQSSWISYPTYDRIIFPLYITKSGDIIVRAYGGHLLKLNDQLRLLTHRSNSHLWVTIHTHSILSLPCKDEVDEDEDVDEVDEDEDEDAVKRKRKMKMKMKMRMKKMKKSKYKINKTLKFVLKFYRFRFT